jgi:hypothetical protein
MPTSMACAVQRFIYQVRQGQKVQIVIDCINCLRYLLLLYHHYGILAIHLFDSYIQNDRRVLKKRIHCGT